MTDLAIVSGVLTSIKTATDIARFFKDTDLNLEKAEQKLKLAELISSLADAKIQIADIQDAMKAKDTEISKLKEQIQTKQNLTYEAPYYFLVTNEGKQGPFCQRCHDKENKQIRLQVHGKGQWLCRACNSSFFDSTYKPSSGRVTLG